MLTSARGLTIGRLAAAAGVNLETIRYYERIRLMPRPGRTRGGHRIYSTDHVKRLAFIRRARELGFSIEDIRTLLVLSEPKRISCDRVKVIASAHLAAVRVKVADLSRLEALLAAAVAQCAGEVAPTCPVIDMLSPERPVGRAT
jgi:MerR family mercuric resistance operon transcriptional regulator